MEKSIYAYILRYSSRQQIVLTIMAALSFPVLYLFYEIPKMIVNGAIQGVRIKFPVEIAGIHFDQLDYLFFLCGVFLLLVLVNQGFKYAINVYRGLTGERMLRRLRYELYKRVLRFPLPAFRKKSQGELISMITAEVEPLGGFIGDAFSTPAFQGGTLLVILGFLLVQNPIMAVAAVALYPLQFYIIPKLQRRVNLLGKERVRLVRQMSERIGETVSGVTEIHANNTVAYTLADFSNRLGDVFHVRYQIYLWKFVIKFTNNTINHLGPFAFYSIGGYLVISGSLEIGTLVAAIAAHKDLAAPWKELLNYYQRREDAKIKYDQVTEQFSLPGMMDEPALLDEPDTITRMTGDISASNIGLVDDTGSQIIDAASFSFAAGDKVAVIGSGNSGAEPLSQIFARLMAPSSGSLSIGGQSLADLPEAVTGRRLGYVGAGAHIFSGTVRENLFYGLKHRPQPGTEPTDDASKDRQYEAGRAGNTTDSIAADWIDMAAIGESDSSALTRLGLAAMGTAGMQDDLYEIGLRSTVDPVVRPELVEGVMKARAGLREKLADPALAPLVEVYDETAYNTNATVAENLLFGTPVDDRFQMSRLAENDYVRETLERADLVGSFLEAGRQIASTMVELFSDLPPGHEFFAQFSFIDADDLPEYQTVLNRAEREGIDALDAEGRMMLLSLPFQLIPARHRLGIVDESMQQQILGARTLFREHLPSAQAGAIEFFDSDGYNAAATIQDNVLFGKLAHGQAGAAEQVRDLIGQIIKTLGLRDLVMSAGLDFDVGIGGGRLSSAQRQKLAIARAIIKQPDILILNQAESALDPISQAELLDNVLGAFDGRGLFWALAHPDRAGRFDLVLVMRDGRIVEQGTPDELRQKAGAFAALMKDA